MLTKIKSVGSMCHHEPDAGVFRKRSNQTPPPHNNSNAPKKQVPRKLQSKNDQTGKAQQVVATLDAAFGRQGGR